MRAFAIIPAAGRSRRMGRAKLLLPWRGQTVIEHVLATWQRSRVDEIVVVVHPDDGQLAEVCRRAGATVVVPRTPPPEMKTSVTLALRFIEKNRAVDEGDCWLMAPADTPGLSRILIDRLIAMHDPRQPRILVPLHAGAHGLPGKRGHPVLFPWSLAAEVDRLPAVQGVNALLDRHSACEVPCEQPATEDIDTPDDYHRQASLER